MQSLFRRGPLLASITAVCVTSLLACKPPPAAEDDKKAGEEKPAEQTESAAPAATGPVARVNGKEVPRADFQRQMDRTRARFERAGREIAPQLAARLKENLIRKLVDDELIRQKAAAEGVAVDAPTLDAKFAEHKQRFGSEDAFKSFLERTSQTEEDVKADLERNLLRDALFSKLMTGNEPTEEDAKAYYEENKAKYKQREQVRASHVLLKVSRNDPAEKKEAQRKKAQEILKQAKKPGADFAAIAKENSEGPTAPKGGDLGPFSRGRMVKEFEEAAFKAKVGQVVGPVETKFGFHVIKVFEKTPERQRTYDEVKDSILTSLKARAKSRATREILRNMKSEAKIEILEPGVQLDRRARPPMPMRGNSPNVTAKPPPGATGARGRPMPVNNPAAAAKAKAALEAAKQRAAQKAEGAEQ